MTAFGTLTAIAIDRYIIISRSFVGQNLTGVSSTITIIVVWIYSLIQALPPLIGWNRYTVEQPGIACSLDWKTSSTSYSSYLAFIFIIGYFMPVGIISFCYVRVVMMIRRSSNMGVRTSTAKAEQKVTIMATLMIFCTLFAWTPYAVVSLVITFGYDHWIGPVLSACPAIFAKTSVVYNPVIYFFFNTQIREVILSKLRHLRKKRPEESAGGEDISMETKRGITLLNSGLSNHAMENEKATTTNL